MKLLAAQWNYHERKTGGRGVITRWMSRARLSTKAQANLERALDQLRKMPKQNWSKPAPASHTGDHIYVIRFKEVNGTQLRVFGHFCDSHAAFVMTLDGYEKDDVYHPRNYQDLAEQHRGVCDADVLGTTVPFRHYCSICESNASR